MWEKRKGSLGVEETVGELLKLRFDPGINIAGFGTYQAAADRYRRVRNEFECAAKIDSRAICLDEMRGRPD